MSHHTRHLVSASFAFALVAMFVPSCTPADRKTAAAVASAVAPLACDLIPVFDKSAANAPLVGTFCSDIATAIASGLASLPAARKAALSAPASCDTLSPVKKGAAVVGYAYPAYAAVASELAGR